MELHQTADAVQANLIKDSLFNLARYGEADGRIRKVAELPLTFKAIMDVARGTSINEKYITDFRRALQRMRRDSNLAKRLEDMGLVGPDLSQIEARVMAQRFREAFPNLVVTYGDYGHSAHISSLSGTDTGRMKSDHIETQRYPVSTDSNGMCYPKPNGGKRIIPSIYTRIKKWWMRANGVTVQVQDMNDGHLENTMKLLHESHGNVIAKSTELLGKMANHFHNDPYIVQDLENLCRRMQTVEVDSMYPIFKELAAEAAQRKDVPCMLTAVNPAWIEDGGSFDWDSYK